VFLILELGSRRILHFNVTAHPTAEWTLQQFRDGLSEDKRYRFVIHDRDSIFSAGLDQELRQGFGLRILITPPQSPKANAYCERLVGTIRGECLDFMIALNESHLRRILREWVQHYNCGRPHSSLGPGIPDETQKGDLRPSTKVRSIEANTPVISRSIVGGLHHEYAWKAAA
jgi:putative transposase